MKSKHRLSPPLLALFLTVGLWLGWPACVWPQSITATLPVAGSAVAINHSTNKIYVASGDSAGVVTIIDGKTHSTTTVSVGSNPVAVAVDEATNKIYVANEGGVSLGNGSVTVIDGATNATTTVVNPNATHPCSLAVNPSTNKVYIGDSGSGIVTVIDGATNSTATVAVPNAACLVGVNPTTNKIYVVPQSGKVSVIDGASNSTSTVGHYYMFGPVAIAVNTLTNRVYVANHDSPSGGLLHWGGSRGSVTVIDGNTNAITTVSDPNALDPSSITLDSVTNKVYVSNAGSGNVTVIDGVTNSTATVTDPNVSLLTALNALHPVAVAVNETTHTVYVANGATDDGRPGTDQGSVTVIDGGTNSVTTLINPNGKGAGAVAVNPLTDEIYVANTVSRSLTIIDGGGAPTTHTIAVVLPGNGGGTVTSAPLGIDCGGGACADSLAIGTAVKLTASATSPSYFSGWSGPCAGTNSCDLLTNKDQFVVATFNVVAVPNVVGEAQAAATSAITGAGLAVGKVTQQSSSTTALGDVISENPAAGTNVGQGSAVDLVVSSGIAVPNVVGQTQAAATSTITSGGLVLGTVTQQSSDSVASGSVISESPAAGTGVARGSTVNLVVSTGDPSAGGGGGLDLLTLCSLLGCLLFAVRRVLVVP